jgi:RNA polymerase sigma factor (sigma-70 family)
MARLTYTPSKDVQETNETARLAKAGDAEATMRLIRMTAPLVFSMIRRRRVPLEREDMESVAHLSVLEALQIFDPDREGSAFSGLLRFCALDVFDQTLAASAGALSMGPGRRSKNIRIHARRLYADALKKGATEQGAIEAVAERLDVDPDALVAFFGMFNTVGDDDLAMQHLAADTKGAVDAIQDGQRRALVEQALESLGPRFALIVRRTMEGESAATIGAAMGISRERVRQLLDVAKPRFVSFFEQRGISADDLLP